MNCISEILEIGSIEQTWFVEKIGKSFRHTNTDVCNCCRSGLEQLFKSLKYCW